MMGLTAAQAEARLWEERRRRTLIENNIDVLRQCENHMESIRQSIQINTSNFREASRRDQANWRGQLGTRYNNNRVQARTNASLYLQEMSTMIGRVNQRRSSLSTELATLNATIRELERIANGGI